MAFSFDFLGKNSLKDFGIYAEKMPSIPLSQRNITYTEVQGRSGSLTYDDETYKDNIIPLSCWFIENENLSEKIDRVQAWLSGGQGDLIFSNQPNKKRIAQVIDQIDFSQECLILGKFQVNFKCKPFKYAVNNDKITLTQPGKLINPGSYYSEPLITVYGANDVVIDVNGIDVKLLSLIDYLTIDTPHMEAYKDKLLLNKQMVGEFPVLEVGDNIISWTGAITKVEILPNWRWL